MRAGSARVVPKPRENENIQEYSDEEAELNFDTEKNMDTSTLNQLTMYIDYKNNSFYCTKISEGILFGKINEILNSKNM